MPRLMLNDKYWAKLKPILLQQGIHDKPNLQMTVDGILFRMRTGVPWRDLPSDFGRWGSVYKRFNYWSKNNLLMNAFKELSKDTDTEWTFIDGSYCKAHQHSAGARGDDDQAIGLSRGGNTSKIHLVVDSYGLPIVFEVTGGDVHDSQAAPTLIEQLSETTAPFASIWSLIAWLS